MPKRLSSQKLCMAEQLVGEGELSLRQIARVLRVSDNLPRIISACGDSETYHRVQAQRLGFKSDKEYLDYRARLRGFSSKAHLEKEKRAKAKGFGSYAEYIEDRNKRRQERLMRRKHRYELEMQRLKERGFSSVAEYREYVAMRYVFVLLLLYRDGPLTINQILDKAAEHGLELDKSAVTRKLSRRSYITKLPHHRYSINKEDWRSMEILRAMVPEFKPEESWITEQLNLLKTPEITGAT